MPDILSMYMDKVLHEDDKKLFKEAVESAKGDALRAAYIMIWITCAESIKRRFRELAARDNNAKKAISNLEDAERKKQSIDNRLIEQAAKYGLIQPSESTKLTHIYELRCIYAHPYELKPSEEELRAAAHNSVDVLLGRPTKLREGFLSEQVRRLTQDSSYIDSTSEACSEYVNEIIVKVADDLHLFFLTKLWKETEPMTSDASSRDFAIRAVVVSAEYLKLLPDDIFETISVEDEIANYPRLLRTILVRPEIFERLKSRAKDIVVGKLVEISMSSSNFVGKFEILYDQDLLTQRQKQRFEETIQQAPYHVLRASGVDPSKYIKRIIRDLKVPDWAEQNPAAVTLNELGAARIGNLAASIQFELGQNVLQAADGSAWKAEGLLRELTYTKERWPKRFIAGVFSECLLNDGGQIRFKPSEFGSAIKATKTLGDSERRELIDEIVDAINQGSLVEDDYRTYADKRDAVVYALDEAIEADPESYTIMQSLRDVIAGLETENPPHFS